MPVPDSIIDNALTGVHVRGRYVGPYAFYNMTSLTDVTGDIRYVDNYAFYGCTGLTNSSINFAKLDHIGPHAFENCTGLSGTLDLGGVEFIGSSAFEGCTNITGIRLASYNCGLGDAYSLPSSVTTIKVPSSYVDAYKASFVWSGLADKIVAE